MMKLNKSPSQEISELFIFFLDYYVSPEGLPHNDAEIGLCVITREPMGDRRDPVRQ
jgi:hypothetical protein